MHYEVAKYITMDEHIRVPEMIIASTKTMGKLSTQDQEIIKQAAKDSTYKQLELWKVYEIEAQQKAKVAGCTITYLDQDQVEAFQAAVAKLNKTEGKNYEEVLKAIAAVK
jgi:TRAP-type C4-dicarboxylate transport system substrate-binding protein